VGQYRHSPIRLIAVVVARARGLGVRRQGPVPRLVRDDGRGACLGDLKSVRGGDGPDCSWEL
jgi:hypothetical protein